MRPRWVVPVEPAAAVLEGHAVAVRDGRIEALLPQAEAAGRFPSYTAVDLPDHVLIPEASLEAARGAGMRVSLGIIVFEFPSAYAADAGDYLRKGLALRDREGEDPLVSFCLAPHAPYTVSDASLRQVAKLAAELAPPAPA